MKQLYKRIIFFFVLLFSTFVTTSVFAEGSKDLYPSGASGNRAFLMSTESSLGTADASWPFRNYGVHYVYAKNGETISFASSAQGYGQGSIRLTSPTGTVTTTTIGNTTGRITSRTAELAGPRGPNEAANNNKYASNYQAVTTATAGVWKVEFIGVITNASGASTATQVGANANWTQPSINSDGNLRIYIAAWDISVRNSTDTGWENGRVYANILNLGIANDFTTSNAGNNFSRGFTGKVYPYTKDGYTYQVDNNGSVGVYFTFFVNNKGFVTNNTAPATNLPIYKSLNTSSNLGTRVQDPRNFDTSTDITHKIFYNIPDQTMPATASIWTGTTNTTWLIGPRLVPSISNLQLIGKEGTVGQISNKGGVVKFDANLIGSYTIVIESTAGVPAFTARRITGFSTVGTNEVIWDGKDGSGTALPSGSYPAKVSNTLQGAEVHFPYIDMEVNPQGIKIQLYNAALNSFEADKVFWNDSDVAINAGDERSSPLNASQTAIPAGTSSLTNGHIWGSYSGDSGSGNSGKGLNSFGNEKSMDTWTFVTGPTVSESTNLAVKTADLKINSITPSPSSISKGQTTTITVVAQNDGPDSAPGTKFGFEVPTGFKIISATPTSVCATITGGSIAGGDQSFGSTFSTFPNGCTVSYAIVIEALANAPYTSSSFKATILRPADITDPDATSPLTTTPTDPQVECDGDGVGCNNILTTNITVVNNPPVGVPNASSTNMGTTLTVVDGAAGSAGDLLVNDTDADGDVLTITQFEIAGITYAASNTARSIPGFGTIIIRNNGSYTFVPTNNVTGAVTTINYTLSDGTATATTTLNITINSTNTAPIANATIGNSVANPGGSNKVVVPTLTGSDAEDGAYTGVGLTDKIQITSLPTNGTLYYNDIAVTLNQIIANYDPSKLTVDPNNGISSLTFTFSEIDAGGLTSTPATVTMPFSNTPPTTNNITNPAIASNQATPVDISNPEGADVDGTVDQYKIVTLPTSGTLYLANGTTAVTAGQVLTVAEANGLKFKPSGTSNATVTFTLAAIDNQGAEDATPATFSIPLTNTPPVSNPVTAVSQSNPGGTVKVAVPTLTGTDTEDGTYNGISLTNTIRITTLPTGGTLYYDNVAVTANQTIANYDPAKLTLDPNNGVSSVSFTYSHVDTDTGVSTPATVTLPFSNTPPTTDNITNPAIASNTATPVDIVNPTGLDIDGSVTNYKIITLPTSGTLYLADGTTLVTAGQVLTVVEADGLKFKPAGNTNAPVTFTLAAIDNQGLEDATPATFSIPLLNTLPVSNPVTAVSQSNPGGTVKLTVPTLTGSDVEDGAYDGVSKTNTIRITTLPTGGMLYYDNIPVTANQTIANYDPAKLTLDPDNGVSSVSFTYSHVDTDTGVSTPATVTLPFSNTPPTTDNITNPALASNTATPVDIVNPTGLDIDGSVTNYKIITLPTTGTLYLADGTTLVTAGQVLTVAEANGLKFKPSGTSNATVTFTLAAIDNQGAEDATPATFEIPLTNTPPTTDNINNPAIASNTATPVDISNPIGADVDGTVTNYKIITLPTTGTLYLADGTTLVTAGQVLNVAEADGLKFKPAGNTNTTVTFTLAAIDNQGAEDATPATFSIPLSNTPPVAIANTVNTNEDTPVTLPAIHGNDTDVDGTVVSSTIDLDPATPGQQITFTDTKGTWALTPATGNVLFTPVPNYNGTATINYTINDNDGATSNVASLTVVVAPVNDIPTANPDTNTVLEDQTLSVDPAGILTNDSDVDGDPITVIGYTISGINGTKVPGVDYLIPNVGTINIVPDGRYTFKPEPNFFGPVPVITYTISDLSTGTATSTLTLNVLPVNDAPSFTKGADQTIATSATPATQTVTTWATALSKGPANESTQVLDFIVTNDKNILFTTQPAIDANGNLTYTPAPNQFGKATVTVKIHDNGGVLNGGVDESATQTFVINIKPFGAPDADITPINTATTTNVIANDGASGVGTNVILGGTNPTNGSIVINPDKSITYTPNNGYVGTDTYTYILETADGVKSDPITVTITVYDPKMTLAKEGTYNDFNANGKVDAGDRINYTFVVTNTGTIALTNITITDANATITGGPIASLAVGASDNATFTGFHVLTQAEIDNGGVFNIATAKGKDPKNNDVTTTSTDPTPVVPGDPSYPVTPPTPACPTCTVTPIVQTGAITLAKEGAYNDFNANGKVDAGDRINYTFVVTNTGNVTLTNVNVADANATITGGPIASLAVGASDNTTFTGFHTLTAAEIDNGGVFNIATATGKDPKNNDVTTTSTDPTPLAPADPNYPVTPPTPACQTCTVTPIVQTGAMTLAKDGAYFDFNADGKVNVGDRINYTFSVANTGNVTLHNITITDADATISGGPIATLAAGASDATTFTGYHTLTQADIDRSGVYNLATVNGLDPKNKPVTATSNDPTPLQPTDPGFPVLPPVTPCATCTITPLLQAPSMRIAKEGTFVDSNADGIANIGDVINYTFTVYNTGNVTLSNIIITDNNAVVSGGPLATLAVGASDNTTFTAVHTLTQADIDNGGVFNVATGNAKDPKGNDIPPTKSDDPTPITPTDPNYPVTPPTPACPTCTVTPIVQLPKMTLAKDGAYFDFNADGKVNAGDRINYTFAVRNTGNVSLTNVTITDADATITGGPIATLAVGAVDNTTFTGYHTLTAAEIDNGGVFNVATATAKDPKGNDVTIPSTDPTPLAPTDPNYPVTPPTPACPTCTVTPIVQTGAMTLAKDGAYFDFNGDGKANVGDRINYTFRVTNTGNVTLKNITITDVNAVVAGGPIVTLAAGATDNTTFTAYHELTAADFNNGGVFNVAIVKGTDPRGNEISTPSTDPTPILPTDPTYPNNPPVTPCATCTVTPLPQTPSMRIVKDGTYVDTNGDGVANIGDRINYTFNVINTGNVAITNIVITDNNATVVGGPLATLAAGANDNTTFTAFHVLTQADIDNAGVFNVATGTGKDPRGNDLPPTKSDDPTPITPTDPNYPVNPPVTPCPTCTVTPIVHTPKMSLLKDGTYADTNADGKINIGDRINYTFNVINTGNVTIKNIVITDANAVVTGGPIVSLAPGANNNTTFTAYHIITQGDIDNGGVFNVAIAKGQDPKNGEVTTTSTDPSPLAPTDPNYPVTPPTTACPTCTVTPIVQTGAMTLAKDGAYFDFNADGKVNVGDRINYTFTVTNTGNVTLTNITVADPAAVMTGGPIASLAVGAQNTTTFTGYHILTQADIDNGGVFNSATAKGKDPRNNDVTTTSNDPTPLAPGSPTYPVTPPTPACPTCTVTPAIQNPGITVTKDGAYADTNADGKVNVGDRINYTFVVTNTGNVTLTNVVITDPNATMVGGPLATLAPGASNGTTFTAYHILTQADIDNRGVFNLATVSAKDPRGNTITKSSTDPTPLAPTSPLYPVTPPVPACTTCTVTPIVQTGAIALVKTVTNTGTGTNGAFVLGNQIQYTFTITNTGNVSLNNITLVDAKLATGTINVAGTLLPGASTTVIRNYTITAGDITAGNVTNTATVNAITPDGSTVTDVSGTTPTNNTPTVTGLGKPPVATNDNTTTLQNNAININIQTNDVAGTSPIVVGSVVITVPPLHGTVVVNADGTVTYTPTPGYVGSDTFTYTVKDANGQTSNPAVVAINVTPSVPKAVDDKATTMFSKPVTIPIIANDTKDVAPFDLTTIEILSQPQHGTVKINSDGTVTYTPNDGYTGTETFTYRIKDAYGNYTNIATVAVLVEGLFFGNVITPDGDGKNDAWVIVGANNYDRIEVEFYNRWGNQVYINKNYKNDWSGERLNEGTYYYTVRLYKGSSYTTHKGWVLIKR